MDVRFQVEAKVVCLGRKASRKHDLSLVCRVMPTEEDA